jgi:putative membrane protein
MPNDSDQVDITREAVPRDPFELLPASQWSTFVNALLATALFRCWHILIFFVMWSTMVCVVSSHVHSLAIQPTLITVYVVFFVSPWDLLSNLVV